MKDATYATAILHSLLKFLSSQEQYPFVFLSNNRIPFVVLVDQVNALFSKTQYMGIKEEPLAIKELPTLACLRNFFEKPMISNTSFAVGALSFVDSRIFNSELSTASEDFSKPTKDTYILVDRSKQIISVSEAEKNFDIYKLPPLTKEETLELLKFFRELGLIYQGMSIIFMM